MVHKNVDATYTIFIDKRGKNTFKLIHMEHRTER